MHHHQREKKKCCHSHGHGQMHPHHHGMRGHMHEGHGRNQCCGHFGFRRHFVSRAERLEMLKKYKDQLEKELAGVTEKIEEFSQE